MKDKPAVDNAQQVEEVKTEMNFYPVLTVTSFRLNEIFRSLNQRLQDVFAIINADPLLTCRTYALYHEFFPDNTEEFFGVARIITELGINTVKNSVIDAVKRAPPTDKKKLSLQTAFLRRSLSAAIVSLLLAKRRGIDESGLQKYYCAGLMHDIGSYILSAYSGADFIQVSGDITPAKAALLAAKLWGLPPALRDAAGFNSDYKNYTGGYAELIFHTALAVSFVNIAAAKTGASLYPYEAARRDISRKLNLSESVFDEIKGEFDSELKKMETFTGMEKA
jgi:hypothetical protein